jgi:hypothetical protein
VKSPVVTSRQINNNRTSVQEYSPLCIGSIWISNMTIHPMEEYIDALVTCEIAMLMAIKHKENPNDSVALCAARQSLKCTNKLNKNLFREVSKSELPAVMVYHFRTVLDEEISRV